MAEAKQGELLVESWVEQVGKLEIDRENRIVKGLVLLGEHSLNGYDYDRPAMRQAADSGLYLGEVLVDQHKRGSRVIFEKFAAVRKTRYVEEEDGVARIRATVNVFRNEAGDTFLDLCEFAPGSAGLSHEARGNMAA